MLFILRPTCIIFAKFHNHSEEVKTAEVIPKTHYKNSKFSVCGFPISPIRIVSMAHINETIMYLYCYASVKSNKTIMRLVLKGPTLGNDSGSSLLCKLMT